MTGVSVSEGCYDGKKYSIQKESRVKHAAEHRVERLRAPQIKFGVTGI